jgi:hypothetical protein
MSMHRRPVRGRRTGLAAAALAVAALTTLGASAPALAAKGGGGGKPAGGSTSSSSISVVLLDSTDGVAHQGQRVTFSVSTSVTNPLVSLKCFQAGTLVYNGSTGFAADYPWPWTQIMTLESAAWTAGAADCTATLYTYNGKSYPTLATASFGVLA